MNRIISLFLFIFIASCLNGQYNSPIKNKVTLGVQTSADGLVWRGIRADTTSKIVPFSDTSAYIILDTVEKTLWLYKAGQIPKWQQVGGSTLDTATMLLPYYRAGRNTIIQAGDVPTLNQNTTGSAATLTTGRTIQTNLASTSAATFNGSVNITPGITGTLGGGNGGTGLTTFGAANNIPFASSTTALATDNNFVYNTSTKSFGLGISNPSSRLHLVNSAANSVVVTFENTVTRASGNSSYAFQLFSEGRNGSSYAFRAKNLSESKIYMTIQTDSLNQVGGDRTGFVGLGTDAPTQVLHLVGNARITAMNNVSDIGASSTGVLQAASASDINLKNTIENSAFGLNEILLLNPVTFFYNDLDRKLDNDVKDVGFIAQDVFDVIPNAVSSMGDGYLQIDYKAITATLVKAMQEQQIIIKALEQRIINLENK